MSCSEGHDCRDGVDKMSVRRLAPPAPLGINTMAKETLILLGCALALVLLSPVSSVAQAFTDTDALMHEADRLIGLVSAPPVTEASSGGYVPEWKGARAGSPIVVYGYLDDEPAYAIVPVYAPSDELVGSVGVSASTAEWFWYSQVRDPDALPVSAADALRTLQASTPECTVDEDDLRVVSMADRRLYWFLSWDDDDGYRREIFLDLANRERIFTDATRDEAGLTSRLQKPLVSETPMFPHNPIPFIAASSDYPPSFDLEVPFHFQETPYNCGPAALHMVFDYWGVEIVQPEIASAANTIPSQGTPRLDLRRAGHFSHLSTAVLRPHIRGYTKRSLGYASLVGDWSQPGWYETRYEDMKRLVYEGYPLILVTWYDPSFTVGHYRVLKGYNDHLDAFFIHDPWYSGTYWGPDLFIAQHILLDVLWMFGDNERWALLAAPWNVSVAAPDSTVIGQEFRVTAVVTYPGPYRFDGLDLVEEPKASIGFGTAIDLSEGETATKQLEITTSGSADTVSWRLVASRDFSGGPVEIEVMASGIVTDSSLSYPFYRDEIGGASSVTVNVATGLVILEHNVQVEPGSVLMTWLLNQHVDEEDLRLVASREDVQWEVAIAIEGERNCFACDEARQLAAGGPVTYQLFHRSDDDSWELLHTEETDVESLISVTRLLGACPNPTSIPAAISFMVDYPQQIKVELFDPSGRFVARITDREFDIGWHVVEWDGRDAAGRKVNIGTYLINLEGAWLAESRKLVLLK